MKLVVGLGNPGEKYEGTRHNVGFLVLDKLAQIATARWSVVKKFNSLIINYQPSVILCKPQTFMNSSGEAASKLVNFYKIDISNLWVIHDDLDIKLGQYKIQKGIGPKLHYGVQSIEERLGNKDFWRVRFGVDNRGSSPRTSGDEYVLKDFLMEERETVNQVIREIVKDLIYRLKMNKHGK